MHILPVSSRGVRDVVSAVQKVMRYNDWRDRSAGAMPQGDAGGGDRYVSASDRKAFIRAVAQFPVSRLATDGDCRPLGLER
jgi:hypothetical protein